MGKASRKIRICRKTDTSGRTGEIFWGIKRALHHVDAGPLHTINESEKSVLFHEVNVLFQNRFRFTDSPNLTVMHPHNSVAELFECIQTV